MSESFWKGAFAKSKTIGTVSFVPISGMSARDWRWLDFDNTRLVARNRIARMIISGNLRGYFRVLLAEKAAKEEYLWPANFALMDEFAVTNDPTFFMHESEALTENTALEALDSLRAGMVLLPIWVVEAILAVLVAVASTPENKSELSAVETALLEEMTDDDVQLLLSTLMMWEMSLEEAEKVLDDLPESDEADEVRDWINDRVAEIEAARNAL